jgi:hypothetical protein
MPESQLSSLLGSMKLGGAEVRSHFLCSPCPFPYSLMLDVLSIIFDGVNMFFSFHLFNSLSLSLSLSLCVYQTTEIVRLAKSQNYQLACQKHFDVTHPGHLQMDLKMVREITCHFNPYQFQVTKCLNENRPSCNYSCWLLTDIHLHVLCVFVVCMVRCV